MQSWLNRKFLKVLIPVMLVFVLASATGAVEAQDAQWHTRFWNNTTFSGDPVHERNDSAIDFDWGDGSPSHYINSDNFSAKWRRKVNFEPGVYRFNATMDDGMRIYVDD